MHPVKLALPLVFASVSFAQCEPLTVVSWGGPYQQAQSEAIFKPFTEATGIEIKVLSYDGSIESINERAVAENWDVVDMVEDRAIAGCEAGFLLPFDAEEIVLQDQAVPVRQDFVEGAFRECSVAQNVFATVVAFNVRSYPGIKPTRMEDFFDVEAFPGKRAVQKSPDAILEWALLAEGVPARQVYDLLSTDRGLKLALRKLNEIRDHIVWWDDVADPVQLLADGDVTMSTGYNGRFFSAASNDGLPITIIWDGRLIGHEVWAISNASGRIADAELFIGFATAPEQLAALAELIPYGPARRSGQLRVGLTPDGTIPMRDHLPNAPQHGERFLTRDTVWYAHTRDLRDRRFQAWLNEKQD